MPLTLHPHLKRGLDFDPSLIDANDLVEDVALESHDAECNAAKRRRVEAIALRYLKGQPPLILTARLKGPFTREWRNPWVQDARMKPGAQREGTVERDGGLEKRVSKGTQVASPEASRAAGHTEDLYSQSDLEPLPATAPLPDDDDTSGATEFFSVDTEQFISNNRPANPFWLRRPAASITFPQNSHIDKSPIKPRKRDDRFNSCKSLQLAPPREPLGGQLLPIRGTPPDVWLSSASATMEISSVPIAATIPKQSPEQAPSFTASSTDISESSRLRADSAQEEEARSSQAAQYAQASMTAIAPHSLPNDLKIISPGKGIIQPGHAQSFDSLVPATIYKVSSTVQVPQSSPIVSRVEQQRSAGKLARLKLESVGRQQSSPMVQEDVRLPDNPRHNLVASPAPASSTGFAYRKVGQPKGKMDNIAKAKPRAESFSSSPALKRKKGLTQSVMQPEEQAHVVEGGHAESTASRTPVEASFGKASKVNDEPVIQEHTEEQGSAEQQESYRSKQSQHSTQAAMLLAQLEFREDCSQSSASSATIRPWSQPAQNTSPPLLPQPSPAITPLSVFRQTIERDVRTGREESVLHEPLISTQDLFDAASPFAFSTVKKRGQDPRRSSLRFALASKLNERAIAKSPTPCAERVPLKEKNTSTVWSSAHDKSSLSLSKLTSYSPKHTKTDVELPQLDFNTSLDFGPTTNFTDCFLKGLNNEP